jgi:hypothetical protein
VADLRYAPRPLYAVLAAHAHATRNRATRELGRSGVWVLMLGLAMIGTTFLAPLWLAMLAVGFGFGRELPGPHAEPLLGALLFGLSYFGGATSGTISGAKQLTWEAYRTYPVRLRTIFLAELAASTIDLMPVVLGVATLALCAGIGLANPRLVPLLPVVALEGVAGVVVVQLLVGALAERIVRRIRVVLNALALVMAVGLVLATMLPSHAQSTDPMTAALALVTRAEGPLERAAVVLPTTWIARSLGALAEGRVLAALGCHLVPLAALALAGFAAAHMLQREAAGDVATDLPPERLWSFRTPLAGVARLQFATILDSRVGRFGLVFPLVVVVLVRGPLTVLVGRAPWAVPAAFIYVALLGTQFQLNQFGLDAHGTKALLLLPIDEADLFRGKARGIVLYQSLQALSLGVFLTAVQRPSFVELASGVLVFYAMVATENAVGRATSVLVPRMLPRKRMQSNATPLGLVLVALFMSLVFGGTLGVSFALLASRAPAYRPLVAAGLLVIALAAQRLLLPHASRLLRRRKETLLAALG